VPNLEAPPEFTFAPASVVESIQAQRSPALFADRAVPPAGACTLGAESRRMGEFSLETKEDYRFSLPSTGQYVLPLTNI
jgi:hypothetical protein